MYIYLAGPMKGKPYFNFPTFHHVTARLRAEGHVVFNPAERDNARHGTDISAGNETGCLEQAANVYGFDLREALADDLHFICSKADAVYLLPGWQNSKGATAERAVAEALSLEIVELMDEG
jgi:hypothetical protein